MMLEALIFYTKKDKTKRHIPEVRMKTEPEDCAHWTKQTYPTYVSVIQLVIGCSPLSPKNTYVGCQQVTL